jgi:cytochrome P450 family 710 subfamily A protein
MSIVFRKQTLKVALLTVLVMAVAEQVGFLVKRRMRNKEKTTAATTSDGAFLPGPTFAPPLIGKILAIVSNPHKFWEDQRAYGKLSWNSLVGKFMVFATSLPVVRSAFLQNGPDSFILACHPNAELILGKDNIAFMHGPSHKSLRAGFLALFTRKALSSYIATQYELIQEHMRLWLRETDGGYQEMWPKVRLMNTLTSQKVFLGDNLKDHELFTNLFLKMTQGFLTLPIYFPGTGLWNAVRAKEKIMEMLEEVVANSKRYVGTAGNEPKCLLDYWAQHMLHKGGEHSSNPAMAIVMMDFLFAAQDASTSSLDWTLCLMADYPDVFEKVRQEQMKHRPNHEPITHELLDQMIYTKAVVSEILRFRPPAPMMPFTAQKDMQLTEDYLLPKGSILIADIWTPTIHGFPNGNVFDPDRMMPDRREDLQFRESFMTFGAGPHLCVGQVYAMNHLATFLAELALSCDITRKLTSKSSNIEYLPTVCPGDCLIQLTARDERSLD